MATRLEGLSITRQGPTSFVLTGVIDMATASDLDRALAQARPWEGPLVIDVSGVTFMDSSGLQSLLAAMDARPGTCVIVHGVRVMIKKLFELTGLLDQEGLHVIGCTALDRK